MPWTVPADAWAVRYLQEGLRSGRLGHAYLLSGPLGVGVMSLARQMAQALLCEGEDPPCGQCRQCRRLEAGTHADLLVVRPGAGGSIGIDAVRDMQAFASLQPFEARGKVLVIDGAEAMTREAANALLKLLEEPPDDVTLVLTTSDEEAIPETVRSRCQTLRLRPLPFAQVAEALKGRGVSGNEAEILARLAEGRLEAAFGLAEDPSLVDARREALDDLTSLLAMGPAARLRRAGDLAEAFPRDRDALYGRLALWASLWRDALLLASGAPEGVADPRIAAELRKLARSLSEAFHVLGDINSTVDALRRNANPRLALEALLLSLPKA